VRLPVSSLQHAHAPRAHAGTQARAQARARTFSLSLSLSLSLSISFSLASPRSPPPFPPTHPSLVVVGAELQAECLSVSGALTDLVALLPVDADVDGPGPASTGPGGAPREPVSPGCAPRRAAECLRSLTTDSPAGREAAVAAGAVPHLLGLLRPWTTAEPPAVDDDDSAPPTPPPEPADGGGVAADAPGSRGGAGRRARGARGAPDPAAAAAAAHAATPADAAAADRRARSDRRRARAGTRSGAPSPDPSAPPANDAPDPVPEDGARLRWCPPRPGQGTDSLPPPVAGEAPLPLAGRPDADWAERWPGLAPPPAVSGTDEDEAERNRDRDQTTTPLGRNHPIALAALAALGLPPPPPPPPARLLFPTAPPPPAHPRAMRAAVAGLRSLSFRCAPAKRALLRHGAIDVLARLMGHPHAALRHEALGCLGNLAHSSPEAKAAVLEHPSLAASLVRALGPGRGAEPGDAWWGWGGWGSGAGRALGSGVVGGVHAERLFAGLDNGGTGAGSRDPLRALPDPDDAADDGPGDGDRSAPSAAAQRAAEDDARREAALLLGQLATDRPARLRLAALGAAPALVSALDPARPPAVREMGAFALGRLAIDADAGAGALEWGCARPLLRLLTCPAPPGQPGHEPGQSIRAPALGARHVAAFALYGVAEGAEAASRMTLEGTGARLGWLLAGPRGGGWGPEAAYVAPLVVVDPPGREPAAVDADGRAVAPGPPPAAPQPGPARRQQLHSGPTAERSRRPARLLYPALPSTARERRCGASRRGSRPPWLGRAVARPSPRSLTGGAAGLGRRGPPRPPGRRRWRRLGGKGNRARWTPCSSAGRTDPSLRGSRCRRRPSRRPCRRPRPSGPPQLWPCTPRPPSL